GRVTTIPCRDPGRWWAQRKRAFAPPTIPKTLMLPRPHIAEQESRHFPLLDFLAAFGDAVAAVVAVDVFERLVARIAHAAMDLHRAVGRLAAQAVGPKITHRYPVGERVLDLRLRELVHLPCGLADQQPPHLRLPRQFHQ